MVRQSATEIDWRSDSIKCLEFGRVNRSLEMNFRVVDDHDKLLDYGRDLKNYSLNIPPKPRTVLTK